MSDASSLLPSPVVATGAGYSLLDSVLRAQQRGGVVSNSFSRLLLVGRVSGGSGGTKGGASASALEAASGIIESFVRARGDVASETTGLCAVQATSYWALLEGPPEDVVSLMRAFVAEADAPQNARLGAPRVIAHVEDVPTRAFGPLSVVALTLPPDALAPASLAAEFDDAHPVAITVPIYRAVLGAGSDIEDAVARGDATRAALLGKASERYASVLPSDERVVALAAASKVRALRRLGVRREGARARD
jgi:hypothetical protein